MWDTNLWPHTYDANALTKYCLTEGFICETNIQKMIEEIAIMQQFNHPNVLRLLGVVVVGLSGPSIVMPFMANGNLGSYLKKNQETILLSSLADSETVCSPYLVPLYDRMGMSTWPHTWYHCMTEWEWVLGPIPGTTVWQNGNEYLVL